MQKYILLLYFISSAFSRLVYLDNVFPLCLYGPLNAYTDSIDLTQRPRFPSMFHIVRFFPVGLPGLRFFPVGLPGLRFFPICLYGLLNAYTDSHD